VRRIDLPLATLRPGRPCVETGEAGTNPTAAAYQREIGEDQRSVLRIIFLPRVIFLPAFPRLFNCADNRDLL
jgi:hypothetical protein